MWLFDGENFWRYVYSFRQNVRTWQTDRQTDTAWRHRPRLCIARKTAKKRRFSNRCNLLLIIPLNMIQLFRVWAECWHVCAGNSEASDSDMTATLSSSSPSSSHLCPLPSLIAAAAAAAAAASVNVAAPTPLAADFHYHKLYGHLLSLAGTISNSPSHAVTAHAQSSTNNFRYENDDVGHKLESRPTAFERYHPYVCRR